MSCPVGIFFIKGLYTLIIFWTSFVAKIYERFQQPIIFIIFNFKIKNNMNIICG